MKEKKRESMYNGHLKVEKVTYISSKNKDVLREVIKKRSAVGGLVFNTNIQKYIFVKQYRVGVENFIVEIPAGVLDIPGEEPKDCMIREVLEETGYKTDNIYEIVPEYYSSPGFTNEKLTLFYVEVSEQVNTKLGVEDEEIEIVEMDVYEMNQYNFSDGKTILAIAKS